MTVLHSLTSPPGSGGGSSNIPAELMHSDPSLTVLICCYSGEEFFEDTFESVAIQAGVDFDVVIHDNGCSESYQKKISRAAARIGARVIRSEINRYGEGVRFDVLPHIETDYVATLHDDDLIGPGRLRNDLDAIKEHDLDYVFSDRYYIDREGRRFEPAAEEVNSSPFESGDHPYKFVAEIFFKGLRFHYSTLVMRTALAQSIIYGDPYLPRIADCLFVTRLLMDRSLRGSALEYRGTAIRVHGSNDMLYSKFEPGRRQEEVFLLTNSELFIFDWIIREVDFDQLSAILAIFPGLTLYPGEDKASLLVRAALQLALWGRSKKLMAAHCVHEAFRIAPSRTVMSFRKWTDRDANAFMMGLYAAYAKEELEVARSLAEEAHPAAFELARIKSSKFWRMSAPLRQMYPIRPEVEGREKKFPLYVPGTKIDLSAGDADRYLTEGFASAEPWGRWTDGFRAVMQYRYDQRLRSATLELVTAQVFEETMGGKEISISVNGHPPLSFTPAAGEPILIPLDARVLGNTKTVSIQIDIPSPKTPDVEPSNDLRALGIGLRSVTMTRVR